MHIENHTFLVTGGASGLGAACAHMISAGGGNVVIADVNAEAGEALSNELDDQAHFVPTDVTDERSAQRAIEMATTTFGALHGAINCAGIAIAELVLRKGQPHNSRGGDCAWHLRYALAGQVAGVGAAIARATSSLSTPPRPTE